MFHSIRNKFQVAFLCCLYLLLKPNLSDQIGSGVLGIGSKERFFRDGLRQQGGYSRNERMEAAVVMKDEAWWQ